MYTYTQKIKKKKGEKRKTNKKGDPWPSVCS